MIHANTHSHRNNFKWVRPGMVTCCKHFRLSCIRRLILWMKTAISLSFCNALYIVCIHREYVDGQKTTEIGWFTVSLFYIVLFRWFYWFFFVALNERTAYNSIWNVICNGFAEEYHKTKIVICIGVPYNRVYVVWFCSYYRPLYTLNPTEYSIVIELNCNPIENDQCLLSRNAPIQWRRSLIRG